MRRAAVLLVAAALAACEILTPDFKLGGEVDIAPALSARAPRTNAVLFVVARNEGGVPLAVHRIVNPVFPAPFSMGPQDLLVPGIRRQEPLRVSVEMNTHGNLGQPKPGDLAGSLSSPVRPGTRGLRLVLETIRE
ncbi:MAG: hypothetical protein SF051_08175 [Elusimicrobiota bacterium]|nr:hypothetical protein [Elusimicrobiota bacterium]